MLTATAKQILSPLAEAVSQLILIISESDINNAPIPDLSALARVVDEQVRNLVNVAQKITQQPSADDQLKQEMPIASQTVVAASKLLLSAATELALTPTSHSSKQKLLEAAKGILQGTTNVLSCFDDAEVRRIVKLCNAVIEKALAIRRETTENPHQLVQAIMHNSQLITQLASSSNKRVNELLFVHLQKRLRTITVMIQREANVLVNACKVMLANASKKEYEKPKEISCDAIVDICREIIVIVQTTQENEIEIVAKIKHLDDALDQVNNLSATGAPLHDAKPHHDAYQASASNVKECFRGVFDVLPMEESPAKKAMFFEKINQLDEFDKKASMAKDTHELAKTLRDETAEIKKLRNEVADEVLGEVMSTLKDVSDPKTEHSVFARLLNAAHAGNAAQKDEAKEEFEGKCKNLLGQLDFVAGKIMAKNPKVGTEVLCKKKRMEGDLPALVNIMDIVCLNPKDGASKELESMLVKNWEEDAKEIGSLLTGDNAVLEPMEVVSAAEMLVTRKLGLLGEAVAARDEEKAKKQLGDLKDAVDTYLAFGRKELDNSTDAEYKSLLGMKLNELETQILPILDQFMQDGTFDMDSFKSVILAFTAGFLEIGRIIKDHHCPPPAPPVPIVPEVVAAPEVVPEVVEEAPKPQEEQVVEPPKPQEEEHKEDVVVVDAEQPVLLTAEEAIQNPIQAAAQEIKVEASKWASQNNPIIAIVELISGHMSSLSHFHLQLKLTINPENKRGFIKAAMDILTQVNALMVPVKQLGESCTDKRLKSSLLLTLDQISALAQQLKILAAVKASSPSDYDKDQQLIVCAQNLVGAVKTVLRQSESASLRQGSSQATDTKKPALKFIRNVYKRVMKEAAAR